MEVDSPTCDGRTFHHYLLSCDGILSAVARLHVPRSAPYVWDALVRREMAVLELRANVAAQFVRFHGGLPGGMVVPEWSESQIHRGLDAMVASTRKAGVQAGDN